MRLELLDPAAVYAGWDWLRAGILDCIRRTGERYRPEDVWLRLRGNTAWAYAADDTGFVIFTQEFDPDGLVLFIWILWFAPGTAIGTHEAIFAEIRRLAGEIGARRIRMHSPRKGWAKARYFQQRSIVYEAEVIS
jgi:hypothetical protein